jgi:hypothetical protein
MCYWPKCENDLNCEKKLKVKIHFQEWKLLKIQYLPHLGSKNYKITSKKSRNLTQQGLSNTTESLPHFP